MAARATTRRAAFANAGRSLVALAMFAGAGVVSIAAPLAGFALICAALSLFVLPDPQVVSLTRRRAA